jgi:hypothetical protein
MELVRAEAAKRVASVEARAKRLMPDAAAPVTVKKQAR